MERIEPRDTYIEEISYGKIRWSSLFSGWLVATAIAMLMFALGAAIGISVIAYTDVKTLSTSTVLMSAIWMLVTWMTSLYLGSYFASSANREADKRIGSLNGIGIWALSSVLTILVGTAGIGATGLLGLSAAGKTAQAAGIGAIAAAPLANNIDVPSGFQAQLKERITGAVSKRTNLEPQTVNRLSRELNARALTAIGTSFIQGDTEAAKSSITLHTSLTSEEANTVVNSLARETEALKAEVEEAAKKAAAYTTMALWAGILVNLISLVSAIAGGRAGARIVPVLVEKNVSYHPETKMATL